MVKKITFMDMAEAMYQLQKESSFYYNPPERLIIERALNNKSLIFRMKKRLRLI